MACYSVHFNCNSSSDDDELFENGLWSPFYFENRSDAVAYGNYYKDQNSGVEDFTVEEIFGVVLTHEDTLELLNGDYETV